MLNIDSGDFKNYALRHYLAPRVVDNDLNMAIQLISLINLSLKRFEPGRSPRTLINQLIVVFNSFETEAAVNMLIHKVDRTMMARMKALLLTFEVWREDVYHEHIEPDHELMMALNNDLDDWRIPCQR